MMTLDEIRRALLDRRLQVVAQATGIHYNTLKTIRDTEDANPTYRVVQSLSEYIKRDAQ